MDNVSGNGYVDVFEWWKVFGFWFKYIIDVMDDVSEENYIVVLDWWKILGVKFCYIFGEFI